MQLICFDLISVRIRYDWCLQGYCKMGVPMWQLFCNFSRKIRFKYPSQNLFRHPYIKCKLSSGKTYQFSSPIPVTNSTKRNSNESMGLQLWPRIRPVAAHALTCQVPHAVGNTLIIRFLNFFCLAIFYKINTQKLKCIN